MSAHHEKGMSRWPALMDCKSFEGRADAEGAKNTEEGTRIHALLAGWLEAWKRGEALPDGHDLPLHEAGALRAAKRIADTFEATAESPENRANLLVEQRVEIPVDAPRMGGVFGTADALWRGHNRVFVADFKTFYNPGRDYAAQLAGYAYAYALSNGLPIGFRGLVLYGDASEVATVEADAQEHAALLDAAEAAFCEREAGTAQPVQCNWCDICEHFATCPAMLKVAQAARDNHALADAPKNWAALSVPRKCQMLVLAECLTKWADEVRGKAKDDAKAGVVLVDESNGIRFALRESKGRLSPRVDSAWEAAKSHGISAAEFRAALTLSGSAAEKLFRGAGLSAKDAKALVEAVSDRGAGSVSLVRA